MKIPLCRVCFDKREMLAVQAALKSGWLTEGPKNVEFETRFADYIGTKWAVTLNSCTSALQLALQALSIKGEVILPSFTFVASANAVVCAGATPIFAEIDYDTCTIDPGGIERKITPKTQALMVVHFAGQSCPMDKIMAIVRKHKLALIEDSAQTIGGTFHGKKTGTFGVGCFSFFPTKNITTGEGGMLTTENAEIYEEVKTLAGHGINKRTFMRQREKAPWYRQACRAGYNYRMSNILAALGVEQLKKLDTMNEYRRAHAAYLLKKLSFDEIDLPVQAEGARHVYQMFTIKLKKINRDNFVGALRKKGIMASVHFTPPVHLQEYYRKTYGYARGDFPVTEKVADTIVTLPLYPQLTKRQLDYMVRTIGALITKMG